MEHYQEDDLVRVTELLRRTGEFIAYFELAETKMMEWRQEIEQHASSLELHTKKLNEELIAVQNLLSKTGTEQFRHAAEKALAQGEANLKSMERCSDLFTENFNNQYVQMNTFTDIALEKIEKHINQAMHNITCQLSKYDVQHFHRIATESCDHVERTANDAVTKSNKLLHLFQFRFNLFTVITTIITAFIIVLYLSDEFPWEMHSQALNERQAGKLLLQAWPKLTHQEKTKILSYEASRNG